MPPPSDLAPCRAQAAPRSRPLVVRQRFLDMSGHPFLVPGVTFMFIQALSHYI
jgi:hypothetical protein